MWCPSVSLSVWTNAWLAGVAAPDDVLDALSLWAPRHSVTAYDAVAAGHTGLPWPDLDDAGVVSLLSTVRTAAGRAAWSAPSIAMVLPVPGDVRGLPAGTQFQRDALAAQEAVIVADAEDPSAAVGLVPDFEYADFEDSGPDEDEAELASQRVPELHAMSWTVYSLPRAPAPDHPDLGEAEYTLRSAVRAAADALTAIRAGYGGLDIADPRSLVEQALQAADAHQAPEHAPTRALRVLQNAAHVDAIITLSADLMPIGTQTSSEAQIAGEALRPLAGMVRSARMAAVEAILRSAWQR